ncbi:methyl-accepting chemotaxis protein [Terasakiella sp. A23]|uniref:methyl-accepting chemotaxis protein n=1 Tax=Terasakiella sp. FCG-A23 TaxID=3080561 RepID=UPI002953A2D7|nr:methyl-accepting chemotaxis protein [Terasakiella sp. A23]MDV7340741.1 methyl-accepting chemotaxis protein [Terasakiella sp. A23]
MLRNIEIAKKLPIVMVALMVMTGVLLSSIILFKVNSGFDEAAKSKLVSMVAARKSELSNYLNIIRSDLKVQSHNPVVAEALDEFQAAWALVEGDKLLSLQKTYITDNLNPLGEKHKLTAGDTGSAYDKAHKRFHPYFRTLLEERAYYDIFLIDKEGNVIYSVFKELDYATNLNTGKWADTDLANVYKDVMKNAKLDYTTFKDFRPYAPSYDAPASFLGMPVFDDAGGFHGVLIYQMPIGEINRIMQAAEGMGESGETYIVGKDNMMRSDSRFSEESTILKTKVTGATVDGALDGKTGVEVVADYRNIDVVSAYTPLDFLSTRWAILAEVDLSEAMQTSNSVRNISIVIVLVVSVIGVGIALMFAKSITAPMKRIIAAMDVLATGDTTVEIPHNDYGDEIGTIARSLQVFKENRIKADDLQARQIARQEERAKRVEVVDSLINVFRDEVTEALDVMKDQATGLEQNSQAMSATCEQTSKQATAVAAASDQAAANVETVAGAAEELSASVSEINVQIDESSRITEEARNKVEDANELVNSLNETVSRIGEVVKLINDIAEQTNLLALNATIEAARAGDAGKGFAVVASEVKNLANQTGRATEEISAQINAVQARTSDAVSAIHEISDVVNRVSAISGSIVTALEEQSAATMEISRNVQEASRGTHEVSSNITGVSQAADDAGHSASDVLDSAKKVNEQTITLREKVDVFLTNVQAA